MLGVRDSMEIEDRDGRRVAMVKKALITPLRDRWSVQVADGPELEVKGNIVNHEYTIEDDRTRVAEVSKRWFRVADTYGVEVGPGQDPVVILAVTVVLDETAHPERWSAGAVELPATPAIGFGHAATGPEQRHRSRSRDHVREPLIRQSARPPVPTG
jgi:LURP-one-related